MKKLKKAQTSVEFLIVTGIIILFLIPAVYYFIISVYGTNSEIVASQVNKVGNDIKNGAREMYIIGEESWITINTNIPEEVYEIKITNDGKELVISYNTRTGDSDSVYFTDGYTFAVGPTNSNTCKNNCILKISPGKNRFRLQGIGDGVIWIKADYMIET